MIYIQNVSSLTKQLHISFNSNDTRKYLRYNVNGSKKKYFRKEISF